MSIEIFHNPRCSKSRATLALLEERDLQPNIRLYLENPPTSEELNSILAKLGISARQLLRRGEAEYKELGLKDTTLSDAALVAAMVSHPRLIERPIVLADGKAAIGRPPENVLTIL